MTCSEHINGLELDESVRDMIEECLRLYSFKIKRQFLNFAPNILLIDLIPDKWAKM